MKPRFRFEKLTSWQEARLLNRTVYQVTRGFPKEELFAVTSQVQRAAVSISANIAEGSGRNSDRDFAHFLEQAYGSLVELASLFYLALDVGYVRQSEAESLFITIDKLARGLVSLNRSLSVTQSKTPFPRAT